MADLGRIARRDWWWFAAVLLLSAPAGFLLPDASWPVAAPLATGIALILGLGFAVVRERTDKSLATEARAARALGLEVLAAVPRMRNADERRTRRRTLVWSCVVAVAVGGATAALKWFG
jgi:hypothetical protein